MSYPRSQFWDHDIGAVGPTRSGWFRLRHTDLQSRWLRELQSDAWERFGEMLEAAVQENGSTNTELR